jgi:endoglucanase
MANLVNVRISLHQFGKNIPGIQGRDYFFPSKDQIAYFKKIGFHSIRLPILWERLQPELYGPLDQQYLAGIISVLDGAAENDMPVVIDLHNYAHYRDKVVGGQAVPSQAFFDVWQKIAGALNKYKALYAYGLMNEPS